MHLIKASTCVRRKVGEKGLIALYDVTYRGTRSNPGEYTLLYSSFSIEQQDQKKIEGTEDIMSAQNDTTLCKLCSVAIPAQNIELHEAFCMRNFKRCHCGAVIR